MVSLLSLPFFGRNINTAATTKPVMRKSAKKWKARSLRRVAMVTGLVGESEGGAAAWAQGIKGIMASSMEVHGDVGVNNAMAGNLPFLWVDELVRGDGG